MIDKSTDTLEQIQGIISAFGYKDGVINDIGVAPQGINEILAIAIKSPEAQEYWRQHDYENDEVVQKWKQDIIKSPEAAKFQMNKVKPVIGALMFLIETKRYKDKHGKTQEYQVMRGEAWSAAEQAIEALKEAQSDE